MGLQYSFKDVLGRAERVSWRVEDLIGGNKTLDFSRPFLPESLARVEELHFLSRAEQRTLNQIRGHAYLSIFGIVEEFILPFVLDYARPFINGEDYRARALLEFAGEEAKHIHLFRRFRQEFVEGFDADCKVIGPAEAIAKHILSHHPLSVALTILHIEWMTQRHFQESVHDDGALDPQFKSLLKHHWMEEMQHAQLDTLMVETIAEGSPLAFEALCGDPFVDASGFHISQSSGQRGLLPRREPSNASLRFYPRAKAKARREGKSDRASGSLAMYGGIDGPKLHDHQGTHAQLRQGKAVTEVNAGRC